MRDSAGDDILGRRLGAMMVGDDGFGLVEGLFCQLMDAVGVVVDAVGYVWWWCRMNE